MCAKDLRKRRGAWDKRQRRALFGELECREDVSPGKDPARSQLRSYCKLPLR